MKNMLILAIVHVLLFTIVFTFYIMEFCNKYRSAPKLSLKRKLMNYLIREQDTIVFFSKIFYRRFRETLSVFFFF